MQTTLYIVIGCGLLLTASYLLSAYVCNVMEKGQPGPLGVVFGPLERLTYRALRVDPAQEQGWRAYARSMLMFSVVGVVVLYVLQRVQGGLPLNPGSFGGVRPDIAFNTAVSFVTNTNWQNYAGESTMSYLTQMAGLAVQNFASAAVGLCVAVALIRGFVRSDVRTIGNFWADLVRATYYLLIPASLVLALVLVSRGVVQTFDGPVTAHTLEGAQQAIWRGPVASQEAIKQLGNNGGGYFNANSVFPFESSTPFTNILEQMAELLFAFSLPFLFGRMVGRMRHGVAIFSAMAVLFAAGVAISLAAETRSTPALQHAGVAAAHAANYEGKDQRLTVQEASIFSVSTTMTSTGAVNSWHDSYTATGGAVTLSDILLGEVSPGGIGAGIYGMLLFAVIAVFIGGLMIGRTPEYLGKQIRSREVKLSLLGALIMPMGLLIFLALSVSVHAGKIAPLNAGPHGFSEIFYGLASQWNNNGSAFAGLTGATNYYDILGGIAMALGRFAIMVPVLALAGSLAGQRTRAVGPGTMPTGSPIFVGFLVGTVLLVGAITFFPAVALGPVAEALTGRLF